jgi:AcrR family transcriptional regulator
MSAVITFNRRTSADYTTAVLGSLGFSAAHIAEETGLTTGQVYYRLRKLDLRLRDYRNGASPIARRVVRESKTYVQKRVDAQIRRALVAQTNWKT